jgi:hypothetical protein
VDEPRRHPIWLRISLNLCGPLGLAATLLGWVTPVGLVAMAVGLVYVCWELQPIIAQWVGRRRAVSLLVFLVCGALLGRAAWWILRPASTRAQSVPEPRVTTQEKLQPQQTQESQPGRELPPQTTTPKLRATKKPLQAKPKPAQTESKAQTDDLPDPKACPPGTAVCFRQRGGGHIDNNEFHIQGNPTRVLGVDSDGTGTVNGNKIEFKQKDPSSQPQPEITPPK